MSEPAFVCPACAAASFNVLDEAHGYCGRCHAFTAPPKFCTWREHTENGRPWLHIAGAECVIFLEPRPHYCDRGNWIAKIEPCGRLVRDLDEQDGWPRYYFDLDRAKLEVEAWMKKRGQWNA